MCSDVFQGVQWCHWCVPRHIRCVDQLGSVRVKGHAKAIKTFLALYKGFWGNFPALLPFLIF